MSDLRDIVDNIRSILYSDVDPQPHKLEVLVNQYVAASESVNKSLRECDDLLQRGLRDEAIQRADAQNLLDEVAMLDFPEREQWADYISICGLPLPPEIEIDRAADLNEAYSVQQPLEPLLRQHRLHALAKSSLPRRIAIMRRIEQQDRNNPIWAESIKEFEHERQRQLKNAVQQAVKEQNIKTLAALEQELRSPDWTTKPAKSLVKQAIDGHTRLRHARARKELHRLQHELNDAYADFDAVRARRARARWNALSAIVDFDASDSQLLDLVGPSIQWLSELDATEAAQQEYDADLAQLRLALDDWIHDRSEFESLKTLEERLAASEAGIPEVERTRLEERYHNFYQMEAGKRRWKVIGAALSVVLLAGVTGLSVVMFIRSQELDQTVASLESLLTDGNLDGAQQFVAKLEVEDPSTFGNPRIQKVRSDLNLAVANEQTRQQNFESKLQEAREIGLTNPSWDSFAAAREVLKSAGEVANRESEVLAFNELGREIKQVEREMIAEEQEKFLTAAQELESQYENTAEDSIEELEQTSEAYARLIEWDHISEEIKRTPQEIHERIKGQIAGLRRNQMQTVMLDRITQAVGNRQAFEKRLTAAKSDSAFSGNRQSQDFASVIASDPRIWVGIEAWNEFIADFETIDLTSITPETAKELIDRSSSLMTDHPGFQHETQVKLLKDILLPVTSRVTDEGQRTDAGVVDVLTNVTIARVFYLRTTDDEWYYSNKQPSEIGGGDFRRIQYFKNLNLDTAGTQKRVNEIANPRSGTDFQWLSPQSAFSREALSLHRSLSLNNWDKTYLTMLTRLFDDAEMDPVFKFQLLRAMLQPALHGSWPLQRAFQEPEDLLATAMVNTQENYFDPDSEEGSLVRQAASDALEQLPSTAKSVEAFETAIKTMQEFKIGERYEWLGWLHLDRKSNWVCDMPERKKPSENESGGLYVIYAPSESAAPEIRSAGNLSAGQIELKEPSGGGFVAGRPVFVVVSQTPLN